ncbi:jg8385 [Pararge aegeria aegeria]|uniref:Jg8385 protein n=1 Tax=Pararge aegeria aegeria TaxID=348720 RepID=A0A8S4SMK5_9NEOP|nr:jg8385 [Pararge aegeria aegeria]
MSKTRRGKELLVYKGYTYTSKSDRKYWYCSNAYCKAKVHMDKTSRITFCFTEHNHVAPKLHRLSNGLKSSKDFSGTTILPMKKDFMEKLDKLMTRKKSNSINYICKNQYQDFIAEVKVLKNKSSKEFEDYKTLANYDVLEVYGRDRLIKPKDEVNGIKFYIPTSELFAALHTMHVLYGHCDLDALETRIKIKFMISRAGEKLMRFGDFTFTREILVSSGDKWCWSCYTHNHYGCQAKVYTDRNILVFAKNSHNHLPTEFFV